MNCLIGVAHLAEDANGIIAETTREIDTDSVDPAPAGSVFRATR